MIIAFEKALAQLLFWIYDFIDTISTIFNILTGTQAVEGKKTLLEVFIESAVSTKVIIALCCISIIIAGACMCVRIFKNVVNFKAGGENASQATVIKQGFYSVLSSIVCIAFVFVFIAFTSGLLNMVNDIITPAENLTLSQNLFSLSVQESYVLDESIEKVRYVDYIDEYGQRVQEKDSTSEDGLKWEIDENGDKVEVWVQKKITYHPYKTDENGNFILQTGWQGSYTVKDIKWSMKPDQVFGVHDKDLMQMFEKSDGKYSTNPMVDLNSFNLFTAYLVAIIVLMSMFMLSIGLVKRIYDIMVLMICMPLVCGTIPLDDGARFRAWRETFMSKVLVAFGAVISINVFFMVSSFIMGKFSFTIQRLIEDQILNSTSATIFKMILLLGGAVCINGSQVLIARILGTSADESREAMQSFAMISSGFRLGALGALGAGRFAMGASTSTARGIFGGINRYGKQTTGLIPMAFRGGNAIGERFGGANYINSRGGAFMRTMGRMGEHGAFERGNANGGQSGNASNSTPSPGMRSVRSDGKLPLSKSNIGLNKGSLKPLSSLPTTTAPTGKNTKNSAYSSSKTPTPTTNNSSGGSGKSTSDKSTSSSTSKNKKSSAERSTGSSIRQSNKSGKESAFKKDNRGKK